MIKRTPEIFNGILNSRQRKNPNLDVRDDKLCNNPSRTCHLTVITFLKLFEIQKEFSKKWMNLLFLKKAF